MKTIRFRISQILRDSRRSNGANQHSLVCDWPRIEHSECDRWHETSSDR